MSEPQRIVAILLAAGRGERLGIDKALVPLPHEPIARVVAARCREAGCDDIVIVRQTGAAPLPANVPARRVEVDSGEMIESLRGALRELAADPPHGVLVFPIDYAMVGTDVVARLLGVLRGGAGDAVVLPICRGRPGHPVGLGWDAAREALDPDSSATLRDVIRRDWRRVTGVDVEDGFVLRDIDEPADLRAALGVLAAAARLRS